jgi:hypothetical protein
MTTRLPLEVVIPLRWKERPPLDPATKDRATDPLAELAAYLAQLVRVADVTVVDGSDEAAVRRHRAALDPDVRVIAPRGQGLNGKVLGAVTGIYASRHDLVVLADDDVRHDRSSLNQLMFALQDADIVRPQNVFTAWPWHARWDTGRSLLARSVGADWPGTFGLRASVIKAMGGWDADVLFENLEMVRTAQAAGIRVACRPDIVIGRVPPSTHQFWGQRLRQAYDDWAQPGRFAAELAIMPTLLVMARRSRPALLLVLSTAVAAAVVGRARYRRLPTPWDAPLWSVVWLTERGLLVWLALLCRACGGMWYHGHRLPRAAHDLATLRRRQGRRVREGSELADRVVE